SRLTQSSTGCRIVLVQEDITRLHVDAIVNAANAQLVRGGGVCGSIFKAAGQNLDVACAALKGCGTGDAVLTSPYDIRHVKAIVHAVGPRVIGTLTDVHRDQLSSTYARSLDVVAQHGLTSIAFPCISTAIYKFPNEDAARTALEAVRQWLTTNCNSDKITLIVFCTYLDKDRDIYRRLLPAFFSDFVDDTAGTVARSRGSSSTHTPQPPEAIVGREPLASDNTAQRVQDNTIDAATKNVNMALPASNQLSATRQESAMPPPPDTQVSLKRKRGRPPQTPTKGPVSKQSKASGAHYSSDNAETDPAGRGGTVAASNP
ncbi:Appr-1-p processing enzyme family protein, partial [Aphelenchoides avenae]